MFPKQFIQKYFIQIYFQSISPGGVDTDIFDEKFRQSDVFQNDISKALLCTEDIADATIYALSTPPHVQVKYRRWRIFTLEKKKGRIQDFLVVKCLHNNLFHIEYKSYKGNRTNADVIENSSFFLDVWTDTDSILEKREEKFSGFWYQFSSNDHIMWGIFGLNSKIIQISDVCVKSISEFFFDINTFF